MRFKISQKTKKKIKENAKNIALEILETIKDLAELWPEPFEDKLSYQRRLKQSLYKDYEPYHINQTISRLKKQGLVKEKKKGILKLTLEGKQKLLIANIVQNRQLVEDGNSCIVIFDIPEEYRKHRKFLRKLLLNSGFINIQKSVLVGPYDLPDSFRSLLTDIKIRQYVTIIKGRILHY